MDGIQNCSFEGARLWFADGERDEWHEGSSDPMAVDV
jgi:hypothetical protein